MRKLAFSVAVLGILVGTSAAHADDELIGSVRGVNATAGTITLTGSGTTFKLPTAVKPADVKPGQVVTVTFKVGQSALTNLVMGGTATGTIKTFDENSATITLDDGKKFLLLPSTDTDDVKVGKKVKIGYAPRQQDGMNMAAAVQAAN